MKILNTLILTIFSVNLIGQNPDKHWEMYKNPLDVGFSKANLAQIESFCDSVNSKALMIVRHGKVVGSWGDISRRYKCHSMRKSLLNALYGVYVKKGIIDINKSLAELGIDDKIELTDTEKTAKIRDLLETRSGIYLQAALEEKDTWHPKRGSHLPGTFQYYNNWDFNVLGSIFIKVTEKDIFKEFYNQIAKPIGMQDYRPIDGAYEYEDYSIHPGYPFKMSTRDLARFGQLFLQNGQWSGKEIIDKEWIMESTTPYTTASDMGNGATGYGYLWWLQERPNEPKRYFALGWGEQYLGIFPDLDLVIVIRSDSYFGKYLGDEQRKIIVKMILSSMNDRISEKPPLITLSSDVSTNRSVNLSKDELKKFVGGYEFKNMDLPNINSKFNIINSNYGLIIEGLHYNYKFCLIPIDKNKFEIEDINLKLSFELEEGKLQNPKIEKL